MKKIKNIFLILIMIMPIFINASSNYYDSVDLSQKYINNFKFHNNYLKYSSDLPWEYDGTKKENKNNFERGGLLNTWEYKVTTTGSETSISYLAPGIGYWLVSDGKPYNYLDIKLEKTSNEELLESRVCEFVKSDTTVEGKGTYGNPWYFKEGHLIAISSNNTLLGKITPNVKNYVKYDDVSEIAILPNANYHFDDTKCKNKAKNISNYSLNNGIITIKNLINDLRCTIDFLPNEYKITLNKNGGTGGIDTLYEVYTVAICQSSDCKKENNIAKITVPTRVGYRFDGYYDSITGTSQIIDASGNIKVNSTYFKNDTTIYARWLANGHSITYALDGGTSGTSAPTSGKYDEILTIDNPTKNITLTFSTVSAGATVNYTGSSVSASGKSVAYTFNGWNITGYDGSTAKMGSTNTTVTSSIISPTKNRYYKNLNSTNNSSITFSATYNAPTIVLPKVTKSYYTCVWTSSGISDIASGGTYRPSSVAGATSRGFTASCSANTYTITLDRNGGTGGTSTLYEKYNTNYSLTSGGASVTNITVPTRAGYTFNGYYTASSGGTQLINASGNFTANLKNNSYTANATIYAQWTICPKGKYCPGNNTAVACVAGSYQDTTGQTTCKVCGNGKTSSTGATASSSCTDCSNKSNISSWKTTSWNTNNTMTNLCAINACATGYNLSNNNCVPKIYTITLDRNGGTGGTSTIYEKYNTNYSLTSGGAAVTNITVPTRAGYTFNGYYTASSGGTQLINASGNFTANLKNNSYTANATIYAQWTICPKGKYCPGNNTAVACAKGTYQDVTGQTTCKSCVAGSYQDTTGQTTCKVCGNGKTSSAGATASSSCTDCSNKSNISSWKTTSWNTNNTMTNLCTINACATGYNLSNNNCVPKTFTVTFDPNGGSVSTGSKTVTYNSTYGTLPTPTKTNYTFEGWYTAASGGSQVVASTKVTLTANQTLYAQWKINYSFSFCYTGNYRLEPNEIVMNNGKTQPISYKETAQIYYGTSSKPSCSNLNNNEWKVWFLTSGNLTVSDTFDTSAFLIGGGASGTSGYSSGGAGGHITTSISTITLVPGESYPIHIGAGGTGNNGGGEATTAFNLTANGGSGRTNGTGAGATAGENGTGYGEYAWGDENVDGIKYGAGGAGGGYCYARYNWMGTLSCPCNYSASWSYVATGGGTMYKAALANTGSGGGAGTGMDSDCGGSGRGTAGGSGIVIIKSSSSIVYNNTVLAKYTAGVKVSEDSNYLYVKLLNTGTLTLTQNKNVDIFMISGGQGGYDGNSTGGAGGRYVTKNGIALEKNVKYEVVIGQGGLSRTLGTDTSAFDYNTSKGNSTGVGGTASSGLSRGKAGTDGVLAFDGNYYGGGGAGGGYCGTSACKCSWSGSGSNNGKGSEGVINKSGGANTGGGGGSGSENACGLEGSQYTPGGPGGSGIVIIRLKK